MAARSLTLRVFYVTTRTREAVAQRSRKKPDKTVKFRERRYIAGLYDSQ